MAERSFADWYKLARIDPKREEIPLREDVVDGLLGHLVPEQIVDLGRIYFGLPDPTGSGFNWFRSAFADNDPSFSMVDNEREAALLAGYLLAATMQDGNPQAGLVALCFSAANHRVPLVLVDLVSELSEQLDSLSVQQRARIEIDVESVVVPSLGKQVTVDEGSLVDDDVLNAALKDVYESTNAALRQAILPVKGVLNSTLKELADLREEVDILWWYIAGWSDILDQPYAKADVAAAAAVCGIELGTLTQNPPGGIAARALLFRTITQCKQRDRRKRIEGTAVTLQQSVDTFPGDRFEYLPQLSGFIQQYHDAFPVLSAFDMAATHGPSPAWHHMFGKLTHLRTEMSFMPFDLGLQAYRESVLFSMLE